MTSDDFRHPFTIPAVGERPAYTDTLIGEPFASMTVDELAGAEMERYRAWCVVLDAPAGPVAPLADVAVALDTARAAVQAAQKAGVDAVGADATPEEVAAAVTDATQPALDALALASTAVDVAQAEVPDPAPGS